MPSPLWTGARAFAGRLVISIALVSGLTVVGVAAVNRGIDDRLDSVRRIKLNVAPAPPEGANYVILGSDTRAVVDPGDTSGFGDANTVGGQRSDTLMVAHVEPGAQKTYIVSFPRDLLVDIPGHGASKINAAYDIGGGGRAGAQLVIDTLQANFPPLKINHFVQVDFRSFQEVVDAIGTVGVYFPQATRDYDPNPDGGATDFEVKAGCAKLTGVTALQYVRSRHLQVQDPVTQQWTSVGSDAPDIHRIERQQAFIRELAGIAIDKSLGDPLTALDIADRVAGYLGLDDQFGRDELNQLIRAFRTVDVNDPNSVDFTTLPWKVNPKDPLGSLVEGAGGEAVITRLMQFGDKPAPPKVVPSQVRVRVVDTTGKGDETAVEQSLVQQGFVDGGTGSESTPLATTDIHYAPNLLAAAKLLLDYFPDARLVPDPSASDRITLALGSNFQGAITVPTTTTTVPGTEPPTTTVGPSSTTAPAPTNTPLALGAACTP